MFAFLLPLMALVAATFLPEQRALICIDRGRFSDAVAGLRADLAENLLTKVSCGRRRQAL
jgi:hypothetical protein